MNQLEVEHCYSGFMGYPYILFIWDGNKLVGAICKTEGGNYKALKL
jgi:hypothetical protein